MIINHINADLSNDLSISKLEKKLNVSKSYIHRCFKKDTGVSITEYLNKKRIAHARNLLINTNYSVMDICMECGFNNRQNFSYIFKKETGITPSEYRKKNTNKEFIAWLHLDQEGKIDL